MLRLVLMHCFDLCRPNNFHVYIHLFVCVHVVQVSVLMNTCTSVCMSRMLLSGVKKLCKIVLPNVEQTVSGKTGFYLQHIFHVYY